MLLTGTFARSLDEKLRLAIPKRLREALEGAQQTALYLAPGTDQSLALYPEEAFARWAQRLEQLTPTRQDVRAYLRLFYAQAQRVEMDGQGRIRIPPPLAALAGLSGEVVLLGMQDHMEVWAADRWNGYLSQRQPQYDRFAEAAFDGDRPNASPPS
jgi:MraZ protein